MKTMNVLGICLKDYSLKESVRLTEQYMNSGALRTVICVTAGQLVKAALEEETRRWLEASDLVIYDDADIIRQAEESGDGKEQAEAQNQEYLEWILKKAERSRYGVYLLAQNWDQLELLEQELLGSRENLRITGRGVLEEYGQEQEQEQTDNLINDINNLVPRVIIARLPLKKERLFLEQNRHKVNAGLFLGMSAEVSLKSRKAGVGRIARYMNRMILKRRMMQYSKKGKEQNSE